MPKSRRASNRRTIQEICEEFEDLSDSDEEVYRDYFKMTFVPDEEVGDTNNDDDYFQSDEDNIQDDSDSIDEDDIEGGSYEVFYDFL